MAKKIELKADTVESVKNNETVEKKAGRPKKSEVKEKVDEIAEKKVEEPESEVEVAEAPKEEVEKISEKVAAEIKADTDNSDNEDSVPAEEEKPKRGRKKKIDEMTPAEQIKLHVQRNTYSVQIADKESKKEIYSSEHVFVEDGEEEFIETDSTIRKEEWKELVASADVERPLKGVISSVTEVDTNKDKESPDYYPEYMVKVRFKTGCFNVLIPSFTLYSYDYTRMNKTMAEEVFKNLKRRIGSEIDFVVRFADEKTGTVYADRLGALSMRGVRNYLPSKSGRRPNIVPGELVQAKIIAIARNYIMVDAAGAEIRIPLEEISWLYIDDARSFDGIRTPENYKIGGRVNVKILTVEAKKVVVHNSAYTLIEATASIKQAKANPRIRYYDEFRKNDVYSGVVTGFKDDGAVKGVYVILDNKIDCLCRYPQNENIRIPIKGDNVIVQINNKDDEKKLLFGRIIN